MSVIPIVVYCLVAALFIFGLSFHHELLKERKTKSRKGSQTGLIVINGGKQLHGPHMH